MKKKLVVTLVLLVVGLLAPGFAGSTLLAQKPPQYEVDPTWP
jgi:hypothetical protein